MGLQYNVALLQGLTAALCSMLKTGGSSLHYQSQTTSTQAAEPKVPKRPMHYLIVLHLHLHLTQGPSWDHFVKHGLAAHTELLLSVTQVSMRAYADTRVRQECGVMGPYINMLGAPLHSGQCTCRLPSRNTMSGRTCLMQQADAKSASVRVCFNMRSSV